MNHVSVNAHGAGRLLLVDDDLRLASDLKEAFDRQGYTVLVVDIGAQAIKAAERFKPDLCLLDVMMPGVDGWEVLTRLRANPFLERVPVIMLTASDSDEAKVRGFALGADDYVTKPFSLQELRSRVAAVLRRTRDERRGEGGSVIPVVDARPGFELLKGDDVFYVEGVHNYTYVHTFDTRYLCRLTLGGIDEKALPGLMRVHRSYLVNLDHVRGCGWATSSRYELRLADLSGTVISVSRPLIPEVQRRLGLRT